MENLKSESPYEILGISRDSTTQEITDAYAEKILNASSRKEVKVIEKAYDLLCDPFKKRNFDIQNPDLPVRKEVSNEEKFQKKNELFFTNKKENKFVVIDIGNNLVTVVTGKIGEDGIVTTSPYLEKISLRGYVNNIKQNLIIVGGYDQITIDPRSVDNGLNFYERFVCI